MATKGRKLIEENGEEVKPPKRIFRHMTYDDKARLEEWGIRNADMLEASGPSTQRATEMAMQQMPGVMVKTSTVQKFRNEHRVGFQWKTIQKKREPKPKPEPEPEPETDPESTLTVYTDIVEDARLSEDAVVQYCLLQRLMHLVGIAEPPAFLDAASQGRPFDRAAAIKQIAEME